MVPLRPVVESTPGETSFGAALKLKFPPPLREDPPDKVNHDGESLLAVHGQSDGVTLTAIDPASPAAAAYAVVGPTTI
jgi:hypothetical protein